MDQLRRNPTGRDAFFLGRRRGSTPPVLPTADPPPREGAEWRWRRRLQWFWRRGPGRRALRRLRRLRWVRRRRRRRGRPPARKRRQKRRLTWSDRQHMPPRRMGTTFAFRRRRNLSAAVTLQSAAAGPRRRRESRHLPWRLMAIFEPRLAQRLPRERFPSPLRNPTRRGHYPWIRVFGPDRGTLTLRGREIFEPRWRSGTGRGPSPQRRGRLKPLHLRLNPLRFPPHPFRWAVSLSRSWKRCFGRYTLENPHWLRMIYAGIHGMRQIQRRRWTPLAQLDRLQRRRSEGRRRSPAPLRRRPELPGALRGRRIPPFRENFGAAEPNAAAEKPPLPPTFRTADGSLDPLWAGQPSKSTVRKQRQSFYRSNPEYRSQSPETYRFSATGYEPIGGYRSAADADTDSEGPPTPALFWDGGGNFEPPPLPAAAENPLWRKPLPDRPPVPAAVRRAARKLRQRLGEFYVRQMGWQRDELPAPPGLAAETSAGLSPYVALHRQQLYRRRLSHRLRVLEKGFSASLAQREQRQWHQRLQLPFPFLNPQTLRGRFGPLWELGGHFGPRGILSVGARRSPPFLASPPAAADPMAVATAMARLLLLERQQRQLQGRLQMEMDLASYPDYPFASRCRQVRPVWPSPPGAKRDPWTGLQIWNQWYHHHCNRVARRMAQDYYPGVLQPKDLLPGQELRGRAELVLKALIRRRKMLAPHPDYRIFPSLKLAAMRLRKLRSLDHVPYHHQGPTFPVSPTAAPPPQAPPVGWSLPQIYWCGARHWQGPLWGLTRPQQRSLLRLMAAAKARRRWQRRYRQLGPIFWRETRWYDHVLAPEVYGVDDHWKLDFPPKSPYLLCWSLRRGGPAPPAPPRPNAVALVAALSSRTADRHLREALLRPLRQISDQVEALWDQKGAVDGGRRERRAEFQSLWSARRSAQRLDPLPTDPDLRKRKRWERRRQNWCDRIRWAATGGRKAGNSSHWTGVPAQRWFWKPLERLCRELARAHGPQPPSPSGPPRRRPSPKRRPGGWSLAEPRWIAQEARRGPAESRRRRCRWLIGVLRRWERGLRTPANPGVFRRWVEPGTTLLARGCAQAQRILWILWGYVRPGSFRPVRSAEFWQRPKAAAVAVPTADPPSPKILRWYRWPQRRPSYQVYRPWGLYHSPVFSRRRRLSGPRKSFRRQETVFQRRHRPFLADLHRFGKESPHLQREREPFFLERWRWWVRRAPEFRLFNRLYRRRRQWQRLLWTAEGVGSPAAVTRAQRKLLRWPQILRRQLRRDCLRCYEKLRPPPDRFGVPYALVGPPPPPASVPPFDHWQKPLRNPPPEGRSWEGFPEEPAALSVQLAKAGCWFAKRPYELGPLPGEAGPMGPPILPTFGEKLFFLEAVGLLREAAEPEKDFALFPADLAGGPVGDGWGPYPLPGEPSEAFRTFPPEGEPFGVFWRSHPGTLGEPTEAETSGGGEGWSAAEAPAEGPCRRYGAAIRHCFLYQTAGNGGQGLHRDLSPAFRAFPTAAEGRRTRRQRRPRRHRRLWQEWRRHFREPLRESTAPLRRPDGRPQPERFGRSPKRRWRRLPRLPRWALPLWRYRARRRDLWRRQRFANRRAALRRLADLYPTAVTRRLAALRRPAEPLRSAFRRHRPRFGERFPAEKPFAAVTSSAEERQWLQSPALRPRWPREWALHRRRMLVRRRSIEDRQRPGWSRRLPHWRLRNLRDRRFDATTPLAKTRGDVGGYRLWRVRSPFRFWRGIYMRRGGYFRRFFKARRGKLRLRELRRRWRYPTATPAVPLRRWRDYHRAPGAVTPSSPASVSAFALRWKKGLMGAVPRLWRLHPLHRQRRRQTLGSHWWRRDPQSIWNRRRRSALGTRWKRQPRYLDKKAHFQRLRESQRHFRHIFTRSPWFTG